jgi:hypothetical protein
MEQDSHIFGTLYYQNLFTCIHFILSHLPLQGHLDLELVRLADSGSRGIHWEMYTGDWWLDAQDQLPAGAAIVPVICASQKTHLTNISGDQHGWPLYLTIS